MEQKFFNFTCNYNSVVIAKRHFLWVFSGYDYHCGGPLA